MIRRTTIAVATLVVLTAADFASTQQATDPLPSWNDGAARRRIVEFVTKVTRPGSPEFVPVAERIAVFDNDGTLWNEQPMYVQLAFALDRVKAVASQHPEWKDRKLYKAALERDLKTISEIGLPGILELGIATHTGLTTEEFEGVVNDWLATARHPRFNRPYTDLVYQPMLEMLAYLRANGFKTFIVSGGSVEFMRPWAERVYGVPPEQVIGSSIKMKYEARDGKPVITRLGEIEFIDDKESKALGIEKFIGRRPIMAFGNSDGDFQMLEWTTAGPGARLAVYVHHDDGERESAYDRKTLFGKLNRGLDEAPKRGWLVVSMKADWKRVFPFEKRSESRAAGQGGENEKGGF